ncbi:hypothetical protein [Burkholderia phage vB_BpP_HN03]
MIKYAGIGSRETPDDVLAIMEDVGFQLAELGFMLRSGGALGADTAFEQGAKRGNGAMEIFIPWNGFNGHGSDEHHIIPPFYVDHVTMAGNYHPNWAACKMAARKLHTRNLYQVLGIDLEDHSDFVICWTKGGQRQGGTGQALRVASTYSIPIFDLALEPAYEELDIFVNKLLGNQ